MATESRRKGKTGELELAAELRRHGLTARRGVQFRGGADSPDVMVDEWPYLHLECKRTERLALPEWLVQAHRDAGADQVPVVVHRRNRTPWLVTLDLRDFVHLMRARDLLGQYRNDLLHPDLDEGQRQRRLVAIEAALCRPQPTIAHETEHPPSAR